MSQEIFCSLASYFLPKTPYKQPLLLVVYALLIWCNFSLCAIDAPANNINEFQDVMFMCGCHATLCNPNPWTLYNHFHI
jgi:hypothetical protein